MLTILWNQIIIPTGSTDSGGVYGEAVITQDAHRRKRILRDDADLVEICSILVSSIDNIKNKLK